MQFLRRFYKSYVFDPETAQRLSILRAQFSNTYSYTTSSNKKIDNGLTIPQAVQKIKDFSLTNSKHSSSRISINLVCKLVKSTNNGFRGLITLPHRVSKDQESILVFCSPQQVEESLAAGAKYAGGVELMEGIVDGKIKLTRCIATPEMIGTVTKLARILGPMGLMPNMKHGTLTNDIKGAISKCLDNLPYNIVKLTGAMNLCIAKIEENVRYVINFVQALGKESVKKRSFIMQANLCAALMKGSCILVKSEFHPPLIKQPPPSVTVAPPQFSF